MSFPVKDMMSKDEKRAFLEQQRQKNLADMRARGLIGADGLPVNTAPPTPTAPLTPQAAHELPKAQLIKSSPSILSTEELLTELYNRKKQLQEKADTMTLDADSYRINIPTIRLLTEDKNEKDRIEYAGNIAVITGVPIIVVLAYLGEIYGFNETIESKMTRLMEFYTVKEVLNVKK